MLKLSVYLREGLVCQLAELKDILRPGGVNETWQTTADKLWWKRLGQVWVRLVPGSADKKKKKMTSWITLNAFRRWLCNSNNNNMRNSTWRNYKPHYQPAQSSTEVKRRKGNISVKSVVDINKWGFFQKVKLARRRRKWATSLRQWHKKAQWNERDLETQSGRKVGGDVDFHLATTAYSMPAETFPLQVLFDARHTHASKSSCLLILSAARCYS